MIKNVKHDGKKIIIESTEGTFEKLFRDAIKETLAHENRILVVLNYMDYSKTLGNRNIFCLNERAEALWQIQNPDDSRTDGKQTDSPFVGMHITKDGRLRATSWCSYAYDVDMETGKLSNATFTK